MANWRKRFPSRFLQAADLDSPIDATIKAIGDELIGTGERAENKPVLYFREKHVKPCVLNQTRSEAVETIAGTPDDDEWVGVRIRLQRGRTRYAGKAIDCVDIVAPPTAQPTKRSKGKPSTEPDPDDPLPGTETDDEEPF